MKPAVLAVLAIASACATTHQSPRVLDPGQVQVTAAIARTTPDDDFAPEGGAIWSGDVQVRRGLQSKLDGGLRYAGGGGAHLLQADIKFQLAPRVASVLMPVGVLFSDEGREFEYAGLVLSPTLLFGTELTPNRVELVGAPKLLLVLPDEGDTETEVGLSVGLRLSSDLQRWAIHPELAYMVISDADTNLLTFAIALSANY